jgi:hypothetical protein
MGPHKVFFLSTRNKTLMTIHSVITLVGGHAQEPIAKRPRHLKKSAAGLYLSTTVKAA